MAKIRRISGNGNGHRKWMRILVFNAGSSNLKFGLFDSETGKKLAAGVCANDGSASQTVVERLQAQAIISARESIHAIGHRVVHGGTKFRKSVRIDSGVKEEIERLSLLSPLHNPPALAVINAMEQFFPGVPQAAVFDTAFFADLPLPQRVYPIPYAWYTEWGLRRFGFHGISHAYCMERAAQLLKRDVSDVRLVVCHLGNGCSASAIKDGRPVATTMGFTPLEGLMMGSRSGSVDPGLLFFVQKEKGLNVPELERILNHESGLAGVSGISSDFREVEKAADEGHKRAQLALDIYIDRVRSAIGSLAATLERLDAVVFTGGVGENSARLRAEVCRPLSLFGISIDSSRNASCHPDMDISDPTARVRVLAIHTEEERMIAKETEDVLLRSD